ncbi:MAG: hypothetical protein WDN48_05110 [Pseudolabrys sp.]
MMPVAWLVSVMVALPFVMPLKSIAWPLLGSKPFERIVPALMIVTLPELMLTFEFMVSPVA